MQVRSLIPEAVPEAEILSLIRNGNERGLELLFKSYYNALWRFAFTIVKNHDIAEDLVQDVFIKFWNKREEINISSSVKAYLYMATRNMCYNHVKASERIDLYEEIPVEMEKTSNQTDDEIEGKELQQQIEKAIDSLPPKCRLVFQLSRQEGKSYKEIAEILEISVKTVENQIGKALFIMRNRLKEYLIVSILISMLTFFV